MVEYRQGDATSKTSRTFYRGEYANRFPHDASLDTAEYRRLLEENGFAVRAHVVSDPGCGHATIWLASYREGVR